jgi:hypothetical protein
LSDGLNGLSYLGMTTTSTNSNGRARGCRCEHPLRSDDTCLHCGRSVAPAIRPTPRKRRSTIDGNPWTPAGVVRALRTHQFFTGRPPSTTEWTLADDRELPSVRTVEQAFGSFEAALKAAHPAVARSAG